jgi:hypothetical protein
VIVGTQLMTRRQNQSRQVNGMQRSHTDSGCGLPFIIHAALLLASVASVPAGLSAYRNGSKCATGE